MNRADRISGNLDEGRVTFERRPVPGFARTRLCQLTELGQSVWLDFIRRETMTSGALADHIEYDCLRGVTSNPAIFEKSIAGSSDYDADIAALSGAGRSAAEIREALDVDDVRRAEDLFQAVLESLYGRDVIAR